jgi:hypothetical protein
MPIISYVLDGNGLNLEKQGQIKMGVQGIKGKI